VIMPREWPLAQGAMAESRGHPTRAGRYYEKALKREPGLGELRDQLTEMRQRQSHAEEAQKQLREIRHFQTLFEEANRFSADHRPREATKRYREALPHAPDERSRVLVQNNLAYVEADELQENYQEALQMAEAATTAEPKNGIYRDTLAWVYYRLGRFADAEREQRLALRQLPPGPLPAIMGNPSDEPVLRYHLAAILEAEGKKSAAVDEYARAVSLGRNSQTPEIQKTVREAQDALRRLGK